MSFNGFISYSHAADGRLAPAVQRGLHRLAKPWNRRRALWIFRDQTGLSVTPALWSSIQDALDGSDYFVLLASPEAARSPWVNREIEHWVDTKSADRILSVVTDGEWQWDPVLRDFTAESTAAPAALRGVFAEEPLFLDLRWARDDQHLSLRHSRFRDAIAQLAAPMHGVSKDDLEGEDVTQHRRARRLRSVAVAALVVLALVASMTGLLAVHNAGRANAAAREAGRQQQLAIQQRDSADRFAEQAHRQEGLTRQQEARARAAAAEASRQEKAARTQRGLAEQASTEAERQQRIADQATARTRQQAATGPAVGRRGTPAAGGGPGAGAAGPGRHRGGPAAEGRGRPAEGRRQPAEGDRAGRGPAGPRGGRGGPPAGDQREHPAADRDRPPAGQPGQDRDDRGPAGGAHARGGGPADPARHRAAPRTHRPGHVDPLRRHPQRGDHRRVRPGRGAGRRRRRRDGGVVERHRPGPPGPAGHPGRGRFGDQHTAVQPGRADPRGRRLAGPGAAVGRDQPGGPGPAHRPDRPQFGRVRWRSARTGAPWPPGRRAAPRCCGTWPTGPGRPGCPP